MAEILILSVRITLIKDDFFKVEHKQEENNFNKLQKRKGKRKKQC